MTPVGNLLEQIAFGAMKNKREINRRKFLGIALGTTTGFLALDAYLHPTFTKHFFKGYLPKRKDTTLQRAAEKSEKLNQKAIERIASKLPFKGRYSFGVIGDPHLMEKGGKADLEEARFRKHLENLSGKNLHFIVINGDLVHTGKKAEIENALEIMNGHKKKYGTEFIVTMGNHEVLCSTRVKFILKFGPTDFAFKDNFGNQFFFLDSVAGPSHMGVIRERTSDFLRENVGARGALFVFHHIPPLTKQYLSIKGDVRFYGQGFYPPYYDGPFFGNKKHTKCLIKYEDIMETIRAHEGTKIWITSHDHGYRYANEKGIHLYVTAGGGGIIPDEWIKDPILRRRGAFYHSTLFNVNDDGTFESEVVGLDGKTLMEHAVRIPHV